MAYTKVVRSGVFAMTELTNPERHREYNWWHSGDHIAENMALEGIVLGTRWAAPARYIAERLGADRELMSHHYLGHYLMTDPVADVKRDFAELGQRMNGAGRGFGPRRFPYLAHHDYLFTRVSPRIPLSPEAALFRPNTGVVLDVWDLPLGHRDAAVAWLSDWHVPASVEIEGVFAASVFVRSPIGMDGAPHGESNLRLMLVCYLDADPLEVFRRRTELTPPPQSLSKAMTLALSGAYETILTPWNYDWLSR